MAKVRINYSGGSSFTHNLDMEAFQQKMRVAMWDCLTEYEMDLKAAMDAVRESERGKTPPKKVTGELYNSIRKWYIIDIPGLVSGAVGVTPDQADKARGLEFRENVAARYPWWTPTLLQNQQKYKAILTRPIRELGK